MLFKLASSTALAAAFSLLVPSLAHAGELSDAKKTMHTHSSSHASHSSSHSSSSSSLSSSSSSSDDDDDDAGATAAGVGVVIGLYVLASPWMIPYMVTEGDGTRDFAYVRYPYADGAQSHLRLGPPASNQLDKSWDREEGGPPPETQPYAAQLSTDGSYQLAGLWRTTLAARVQTPLRFELDSAYSFYVEPLANRTDTAWLGATHLSYRFAQTESVQFHTGLGVRQFSDRTGTTFGFDFEYGIDIFWGKPFVSSLQVNVGSLDDALVAQFRGTLGVTLGRAEIFAGYDHVAMKSMADERVPGVGLGGPILGLRLWL